jgi:hypothetical protein
VPGAVSLPLPNPRWRPKPPSTERFPVSRPADQEALRINQLVESSANRAMATALLLADVGYYEAEIAASRRCLQSVAAR